MLPPARPPDFPQLEVEVAAGKHPRLRAIDQLRGVAILVVLATHLPFSGRLFSEEVPSQVGRNTFVADWLTGTLRYGRHGVTLFLVISGFCIHWPWARARDPRAGIDVLGFWGRRLRRLYPPYLLVLLGCTAALFLYFSIVGRSPKGTFGSMFGFPSTEVFLLDLLGLILMAQNLSFASRRIGNSPLWSLALEEQLYLLYFPLLALRKAFGWTASLAVVALVGLLWHLAAIRFGGGLGPGWLLLGPAAWLTWTLGAVAVEAHAGKIALPPLWRSPIAGFGFTALGFLSDPQACWGYSVPGATSISLLCFSLGFFVWVNLATAREARGTLSRSILHRSLEAVGRCSYSLFLTHYPVYNLAKLIGLRAGAPPVVVLLLRITLAGVIGYGFHVLVERRAIAWAHRRARPVVAARSA